MKSQLAVAVCCASAFLVNLESTIVYLALPVLGRDFMASISQVQWVVDSYIVAMSSMLIMGGALGDRYGRRRMFVTGLGIFAVASVFCALADSVQALVAARIFQGVGAAMLNPNAKSLISEASKNKEQQSKGFALWGTAIGVGMAAGPLIGGPLITVFGWRSIFILNVPIAIAILILIIKFVPNSSANNKAKLDLVGQILAFCFSGCAVYAIIGMSHVELRGGALVAAGVAIVAIFLFILYESRASRPLIKLGLFRSWPFSLGIVMGVLSYAAIGAFLFLNTLQLQRVMHMSTIQAGLWNIPIAVAVVAGSRISIILNRSRGGFVPVIASGIGIFCAAALMFVFQSRSNYAVYALAIVLFGASFGALNGPLNAVCMSGMPRTQAGVAGAIGSSSGQFGFALGVAVAGSILSVGISSAGSIDSAFKSASLAAWVCIAVSGVIMLILAKIASTNKAFRSASRVATLLE